jgi:hypothetical protein
VSYDRAPLRRLNGVRLATGGDYVLYRMQNRAGRSA